METVTIKIEEWQIKGILDRLGQPLTDVNIKRALRVISNLTALAIDDAIIQTDDNTVNDLWQESEKWCV